MHLHWVRGLAGPEGVNTKTKMIKRQVYGRALLRHRILLG
jgi:transposase